MTKESAEAILRKIRTETARRKRVWRLMRAAGFEAAQAVKTHAKQQGVTSLDWFRGIVDEPTIRVFYQIGRSRSEVKSFELRNDGWVLKPDLGDATYEGYPNLTDKDPAAFKKAAVETLLEKFNEHRQHQREQRRRRRR